MSYPGGGERLLSMIHQFLLEMGIETKIIENCRENRQRNESSSKTNFECIENTGNIKFGRFGFPKFLFQDLPPINFISNDPDALSIIFLRRVPPRSYLKKLSESQKKVVFGLHGISIEKLRLTHPLIVAQQLLTRLKLMDLASCANGNINIQVLTEDMKRLMLNHGSHPKNIFLIENEFESPLTHVGRNDEAFNVLFIGRIVNLTKGISLLKKTSRLLKKMCPNIKIKIVGTGKDSKLLNNISKNTTYFGKISDDEKFKIVQSSNLSIVTSNLEPFPRVILEFLSSGLPVVTTPSSGPSYVISKNNEYGLISSFNKKKFVNDVIGYYNLWEGNKQAYYELKQSIASSARATFITNRMLEAYSQMISQILVKK